MKKFIEDGTMRAVKKLLFFMFLVCTMEQGFAAIPDRTMMLKRTNVLMDKLIEFVEKKRVKDDKGLSNQNDGSQLIIDLERLMSQEKNPAVLARVALVARVYGDHTRDSHQDEDYALDAVLTEVWFACLSNIKKLGGPQALAALDDIQRNISYQTLDGAYSLVFRRTREEIEQDIKTKNSKAKMPPKSSTLIK